MNAERLRELEDACRRHFGPETASAFIPAAESILVRAPGRVNIIGEHTDYNDGFVLPCAIDRDILLLGRRRKDTLVRVHSVNLNQTAAFTMDDLPGPDVLSAARGSPDATRSAHLDRAAPWSNYIRGVIWALQAAGHAVGGFDAALTGNIPAGAGLSSSAALEVATVLLVQHLFDVDLEPEVAAKLSQRAENAFVGVQCGIMDQFSVSLSRPDRSLLLDCRTLQYRFVSIDSDEVRLVVADTGVRRGLVQSAYNVRRLECEQAVQALHTYDPNIHALRDVTPTLFERYGESLPEVVRKRAEHVVRENTRVLDAATALENNDFDTCGQLMNESHASLRDLYEVSSPELDAMADIARAVPGVYGSRMTGAGFGGCTVSLVRTAAVAALVRAIEEQYPQRTGKSPQVYVVRPSGGARRIR